jgi:hypothetical protein
MWSYNQHNARNIIRANWRFMKNLMAGVSSSSGLNGSFLAADTGTEFWGYGYEHGPSYRGKCFHSP